MIEEINKLMLEANNICIISGAGISAESGVPTFRDSQSGLWAKYNPEDLASVDGWKADSKLVWNWYLSRFGNLQKIKPNNGHNALAEWEKIYNVSIVTQNIDILHEKAGSKNVFHLHGKAFDFKCDKCDFESSLNNKSHDLLKIINDQIIEVELGNTVEVITCPKCVKGQIRPDIVWFGENLPEQPWINSVGSVEDCDLLFVIGTSGIVYPAAGLPQIALAKKTPIIEINPNPSPISDFADFVIRDSSGISLPKIRLKNII